MKKTFILFGCLFSFTLLQADLLSTEACCGKKKKHRHEKPFCQEILFKGGCGCGGNGGNGSNEIPPDNG
jgi:hypothetical protein